MSTTDAGARRAEERRHLRDLVARIQQFSLPSQLRLAAALYDQGEYIVAETLARGVADTLAVRRDEE